jgi:hypothetical protein
MHTFLARCLAMLLLAVLAGCAISPESQEGRNLHDALWQQAQRQRQEQVLRQPADRPRLLVLAVGLSDETKAFPGDVNGVVASVRSLRSDALVWQMWNSPFGETISAPFATRESLQLAVAEMRAAARPGDRILVMFSSHGHHNLLAHVAANRRLPPLQGQELRDLLQPLSAWDTGVIISACHSGSLIPALRHPRRWIMTAAAADRVSYGCQFHGQQTYFIQALLQAQAGPEMGLDTWHAQAAQIVRRGEDLAKFTPSLPQLWVGSEVAPYRQSLSAFWRP